MHFRELRTLHYVSMLPSSISEITQILGEETGSSIFYLMTQGFLQAVFVQNKNQQRCQIKITDRGIELLRNLNETISIPG